jgi:hypothetical protein
VRGAFNYHINSSSKLKSIYFRLFNIFFLAARGSVLSSSSGSLKYKSIRHQQFNEDYFLFLSKESRDLLCWLNYFSEIVTSAVLQSTSTALPMNSFPKILKPTA